MDLLSHCFSTYIINCCIRDLAGDWSSNVDLTSSNPGLTSSTGRSGSDRRHLQARVVSEWVHQAYVNRTGKCGSISHGLASNINFTGRPSRILYATDAIIANLVRELPNCSNRASVHCLDMYTRSLFMSIVHRPSETLSFWHTLLVS